MKRFLTAAALAAGLVALLPAGATLADDTSDTGIGKGNPTANAGCPAGTVASVPSDTGIGKGITCVPDDTGIGKGTPGDDKGKDKDGNDD